MPNNHFVNNLRLNDGQRKNLLDHMDRGSKNVEGGQDDNKRSERRVEFRDAQMLISIEHPAGGISNLQVITRNISSGGMSFLHGGYIHTRSRCKIRLARRQGSELTIQGTVRSCRHVRDHIHEIGVQFDRKLDVQEFLHEPGGDSGSEGEFQRPTDLRGTVLLVDASDADSQLFAHFTRETGITLVIAKSLDDVVKKVKAHRVDMAFVELRVGKYPCEDVIRKLREMKFNGPMVIVTAESGGDPVGRAKKEGASYVLGKPYSQVDLMNLLGRLHRETGAIASGDCLFSTVEDQPGMLELIRGYISQVRTIAGHLDSAIMKEDVPAVRELCLQVKGSAGGYGFTSLGAAASDSLRMLDASMSIQESASALRRLGILCRQVSTRSGTGSEKEPGVGRKIIT